MLLLEIINQEKGKEFIPLLKEVFQFVLSQKEWESLNGEINLILLNNSEIQKLNSKYREKKTSTDVLSFPYLSFDEIIENNDQKAVIGEIFISLEKIEENASLYKNTFQEELNKIFVHGILHILGYDHIDDNDFLVMKKMEDFLLKSFYKEKNK